MIKFCNVSFHRQGIKIINNISWELLPGEHWLIQGANGTGKTTVLELIAGLKTPSSGEVQYSFADQSPDVYTVRRERIHYIPTHALQTFLSDYHDLFYQQRYYSIGDGTQRTVRDVLGYNLSNVKIDLPDSFRLDTLLDVEITRLSNGQLKKLLLLKNFLKNIPSLLLMDYPFEGLDANSRKDFISFLDFFSKTYQIQLVITDHHHQLPSVINRRMILGETDRLRIVTFSKHLNPTSKKSAIIKKHPVEGETLVEMKGVNIIYGSLPIITNLYWKINKGERWALTGRNGSGKTTLFSLIYADHPMAYSQPVYLFGKKRGSGESIWDIKRRINYLGPEHIHYLNKQSITSTAREYIQSQNTFSDTSKIKKLIDFLDAGSFVDKQVRYLASGELQCMMLINFFLTDKELLLLDEPFQFLDNDKKQRVNDFLNNYLSPEKTLVLVTHYDEDIMHWTQQILTLS